MDSKFNNKLNFYPDDEADVRNKLKMREMTKEEVENYSKALDNIYIKIGITIDELL